MQCEDREPWSNHPVKITASLFAIAFALAVSQAEAHAMQSQSTEPDLTRGEARTRADQLFTRFDLNHDGVVTRREAERLGSRLMLVHAKTGVDSAPGIGGHTLKFLRRQFAGIDAVSREQFVQAFLDHFDQMDTNHDGILTPAERQGPSK